ncbi:MAG: bacteriophage Gp15 family protein [Oscillospiraceae bacterium]|nr:bacteriophage Gp15 family protein [Oscillospiraceae bacterium]
MSFSLSRPLGDILPSMVRWQDAMYEVNADFRVILKILRLSGDESVPSPQKVALATRMFFKDNHAPEDVFGAVGAFLSNAECKAENLGLSDDESGVAFCYEFDAAEIFASFWAVYGVDLLQVGFMHWVVFRKLLAALPDDCAFQCKLRLRELDTSALSGDERQRAEAARLSVALPETARERRGREAFERIWG